MALIGLSGNWPGNILSAAEGYILYVQ